MGIAPRFCHSPSIHSRALPVGFALACGAASLLVGTAAAQLAPRGAQAGKDGPNDGRDQSIRLHLRYADFDPVLGEPPVPNSLDVVDVEDNRPRAYIVQFITQTTEAYRARVRAAGGVIYKYLPDDAYLVHLDAQARDAVAQMPFVRYLGEYRPAYKFESRLLDVLANDPAQLPPTRVNIMVFERGLLHKQVVAQRIGELGGVVNNLTPTGFIVEATLDGPQLIAIAQMHEVMWIDVPGERELDMDIAREIGGANHIETVAGYTGEGVRAEVMDSNLFSSHVDFQARPPIFHGPHSGSDDHGTGTYGINFGDGTGNQFARGMVPDAQGIFADFSQFTDRYQHTAELLQSPYFAVYQSNSWGNQRTRAYTSISAEMDDIIFGLDILITQSQSNAGTQDSRPQAWAKNIVSVGGVNHQNTLPKSDDVWGGASIGPAEDGRIKPDLVHFYDSIWTTDDTQNGYRNFGGTSGATPIVAGHFGLFFQMWADGIFGNTVDTNGTVFDNRPHFTTAKAMMVNTADSYPFSGTNHNLTRTHQGWGMPDLQYLYEHRDRMFIVNETEVLSQGETAAYQLTVAEGEPQFRATLVYADPMGTTSSTQHRINDLSLKVTSPGGATYWGNNGLLAGNWSTTGGTANTKDTVENVFVQNPQAGVWTVEVIASEINEDSHLETGPMDADFALVVSGIVPEQNIAELTNVDVTRGSALGGGLAELTVSDDAYFHTRSGFGPTLIDVHSMVMEVTAQANGSPTSIDVTIESRVDQPTAQVQVWAFNYNTGQFDLVHTYAIDSADSTETIAGLGAGPYVSGSGEIRLRVKHIVMVPFIAFNFDSYFDLFEVGLN